MLLLRTKRCTFSPSSGDKIGVLDTTASPNGFTAIDPTDGITTLGTYKFALAAYLNGKVYLAPDEADMIGVVSNM